jgi:hypothetical protein
MGYVSSLLISKWIMEREYRTFQIEKLKLKVNFNYKSYWLSIKFKIQKLIK